MPDQFGFNVAKIFMSSLKFIFHGVGYICIFLLKYIVKSAYDLNGIGYCLNPPLKFILESNITLEQPL